MSNLFIDFLLLQFATNQAQNKLYCNTAHTISIWTFSSVSFCEVLVKQRLGLVKEGEKAGTKEQAKEAAHIAHQVKEVKDPHLCLHWEGPGCQIQDKGLVHTFNKTRVFFNNEGHRFILLSEENCEANCVENNYNYTMYEHMK